MPATPADRTMAHVLPLFFCQPPTGYADTADAWVNTGALLNRMTFAGALAEDRTRH